MDHFNTSCQNANEYPKNLLEPGISSISLEFYAAKLNEKERSGLFCKDDEVSVDVWEHLGTVNGFRSTEIHKMEDLRRLWPSEPSLLTPDPLCRFVFFRAPSIWHPVLVNRAIFLSILSYLQIRPFFLDFLFSFLRKRKQQSQDITFSSFRHACLPVSSQNPISMPCLGRSGRHSTLCYNVKPVKPMDSGWPWYIGQLVVYHSLDLESGQVTWLVLGDNKRDQNRVKDIVRAANWPVQASSSQSLQLIAPCLRTHLMICEWTREQWRWYIDFLESEVDRNTYPIVSAKIVGSRPRYMVHANLRSKLLRDDPTTSLWHQMRQSLRLKANKNITINNIRSQFSLSSRMTPPQLPPDLASLQEAHCDSDDQGDLRIADVQETQHLEEKVNEARTVLHNDIEIIKFLEQHFLTLSESPNSPPHIKAELKTELPHLQREIAEIRRDLEMYKRAATALRDLLADRKNLLNLILEFRSQQDNKSIAETNVLMTAEMQQLTIKTKEEAVSMRIITLVTLFFLPGTFVSTLMSTDIVHFDAAQASFSNATASVGALQLFFILSLPLMAVTFAAWYAIYWYITRRERRGRI